MAHQVWLVGCSHIGVLLVSLELMKNEEKKKNHGSTGGKAFFYRRPVWADSKAMVTQKITFLQPWWGEQASQDTIRQTMRSKKNFTLGSSPEQEAEATLYTVSPKPHTLQSSTVE